METPQHQPEDLHLPRPIEDEDIHAWVEDPPVRQTAAVEAFMVEELRQAMQLTPQREFPDLRPLLDDSTYFDSRDRGVRFIFIPELIEPPEGLDQWKEILTVEHLQPGWYSTFERPIPIPNMDGERCPNMAATFVASTEIGNRLPGTDVPRLPEVMELMYLAVRDSELLGCELLTGTAPGSRNERTLRTAISITTHEDEFSLGQSEQNRYDLSDGYPGMALPIRRVA